LILMYETMKISQKIEHGWNVEFGVTSSGRLAIGVVLIFFI